MQQRVSDFFRVAFLFLLSASVYSWRYSLFTRISITQAVLALYCSPSLQFAYNLVCNSVCYHIYLKIFYFSISYSPFFFPSAPSRPFSLIFLLIFLPKYIFSTLLYRMLFFIHGCNLYLYTSLSVSVYFETLYRSNGVLQESSWIHPSMFGSDRGKWRFFRSSKGAALQWRLPCTWISIG